jgi:hypothetical protein
MPLDSELNMQDNLIAQIMSALEGKTAGGQSSTQIVVGNIRIEEGSDLVEMSRAVDYTSPDSQFVAVEVPATGIQIEVVKGSLLYATDHVTSYSGCSEYIIGYDRAYIIEDNFDIVLKS